jgi:hypothetical protein
MGKSSNKLVDFPLNYVSLREGRLYWYVYTVYI